jgi:Lrp/AsnC family transcriptional regulator, leucine-responsive regulatory protein
MELDKFDLVIIETLKQNARVTLTDLATVVGLSKTPCQTRMKRLESRGVIKGYTVLVDHAKLGSNHIAFAQVTLGDTRSSALSAFNEAVRKIPAVEQCHMTAGTFDYMLKVRTRNMEEYRTVLGESISSLPHVIQTSTFVVMESVKETGT